MLQVKRAPKPHNSNIYFFMQNQNAIRAKLIIFYEKLFIYFQEKILTQRKTKTLLNILATQDIQKGKLEASSFSRENQENL